MKLCIKYSTVCFILILAIFTLVSVYIFDNVYKTSKVVVDEEFHLPMGLAYCRYQFSLWDSKVTTLPGLYLISTMILAPFEACNSYWLRFVSLGAAVFNIPLLYILLSKNTQSEWHNVLSSVTLALIPPLYFFSHFYYTDVVSLTAVLMMFVLYYYGCHYLCSFWGVVAVLCRQTNIIWVLYLLGQYIFPELVKFLTNIYDERKEGKSLKNMQTLGKLFVHHSIEMLKSLSWQYILDCSCYLSVICTFLVFVFINGGIVVGDKTAHEAGIHIPQLFYFSLFCMVFAWPHFVCELSNFLTYARRHKMKMFSVLVLCLVIIHFNTIVHPYLLADNRHYTFYIWNRFYGRYQSFRYTVVPIYMFAWYVICKAMCVKNNISTLIIYSVAVVCLLVPQKLIDVRYYFIPYIIFRLHIKNNSYTVFNLILEFVTYVIMNVITFNLFFTKQIYWSDYDQPQRLIW